MKYLFLLFILEIFIGCDQLQFNKEKKKYDGFVKNNNGHPIPNIPISLVDRNYCIMGCMGGYIDYISSKRTDSKGYFDFGEYEDENYMFYINTACDTLNLTNMEIKEISDYLPNYYKCEKRKGDYFLDAKILLYIKMAPECEGDSVSIYNPIKMETYGITKQSNRISKIEVFSEKWFSFNINVFKDNKLVREYSDSVLYIDYNYKTQLCNRSIIENYYFVK